MTKIQGCGPLNLQYLNRFVPFDDIKVYQIFQRALQDKVLIASTLLKLEILVQADRLKRGVLEWYGLFLAILGNEFKSQVFAGLLKEGIFLGSIGEGILALDPGADFMYYVNPLYVTPGKPSEKALRLRNKHGALTHVFQWLILKEAMINPSGGNQDNTQFYAQIKTITLIEYFKNTSSLRKMIKEPDDDSIWNALLDVAPGDNSSIPANATLPEGVTNFIEAKDINDTQFFPHLYDLEVEMEIKYTKRLATMPNPGPYPILYSWKKIDDTVKSNPRFSTQKAIVSDDEVGNDPNKW